MDFLPSEYGDIYLPCIGRADIIQILRAHGQENHINASDINPRLVLCHNAVKRCPEEVISVLEEHRHKHSPDYYLEIRDRFHPNMPLAHAGADHIYIANNAYWGVIRMAAGGQCTNINARTKFNFSPEAVRNHSRFLRSTDILAEDYAATVSLAKPGDLVILDPPYFQQGSVYGCLGFSDDDHYRLRNVCNDLHRRGIHFLVTNSDKDFIRSIYRNFCIKEVVIKRTIRRRKNGGYATELWVTNY
jgi:DNA adenine methylase